jgi:hypothetical protein
MSSSSQQELDPLSPRANSVGCWQNYWARRYDEAIEQARKTLELDPNYMPGYWCFGSSARAEERIWGSDCGS